MTNGNAVTVAAALQARQTFLLTSHARPDGDAIGSAVALALALEQTGKRTTVLLHDRIPEPYLTFPAVDRIEITNAATGSAEAAVLLECSDLSRPGLAGLDRYLVINVDHHLGNAMYGAVNWFDASAAACGEMVADIIDALNVPWTPAIATHLYLALATDTGGFRYGPISARTFEICRRIAALGVDTAALARRIFDSFSIGRVRLTGAILSAMELHHDGRLAVLRLDEGLLQTCGASIDDTEGLVNLPLAARGVQVAILIKQQSDGEFRVSLRSKDAVDIRAVANRWQGGGHRNAAGCTALGTYEEVRTALVEAAGQALVETPTAR